MAASRGWQLIADFHNGDSSSKATQRWSTGCESGSSICLNGPNPRTSSESDSISKRNLMVQADDFDPHEVEIVRH